MDALKPVTSVHEFYIEQDNLKDQLHQKRKVKFFLCRF